MHVGISCCAPMSLDMKSITHHDYVDEVQLMNCIIVQEWESFLSLIDDWLIHNKLKNFRSSNMPARFIKKN